MSTFIPVHDSLWTHRKTLILANELDLPVLLTGAHIIHLWHWAVENAPNGNLAGLPAYVVAQAAAYTGDPERFRQALLGTEFLDPDGTLHNWEKRNGRLIQRRKEHAEYMRRKRQSEDAPPAGFFTGAAHVSSTCAPSDSPREAEQNNTVENRREENSNPGKGNVVAFPGIDAHTDVPTHETNDDDDRPEYDSEVLKHAQSQDPEGFASLQNILPPHDRDDLIMLARLVWYYPLVDLVHESQKMRARFKRTPASWAATFNDWLQEGRTVLFLDGGSDQARHGTVHYLPAEERYDVEESNE